jgi:3-keto-5-aminohexanoate cleavage enzyme
MNVLAIAMGGHCRVGLEDNIYHGFNRGELATNEGLVERVANISEAFGRPLASSSRARALMGLGRSAGRAEPAAFGAFES